MRTICVCQIESTNLICTSKVSRREFKYLQMKRSSQLVALAFIYLFISAKQLIPVSKRERKRKREGRQLWKKRTQKVATRERGDLSTIRKSDTVLFRNFRNSQKSTDGKNKFKYSMHNNYAEPREMATNRIHWITKGTEMRYFPFDFQLLSTQKCSKQIQHPRPPRTTINRMMFR